MKPADHPEFYRLPPPPGRSRESSIVLDARGQFWHDGKRVEHPGMARAFAGWIGRHPDDGRYILDNGYDWTYLTVEDAPFTVSAVKLDCDPPLLELSDGSSEPLDGQTLRCQGDDALYVDVKSGRFHARFSADAQLSLAEHLVECGSGIGLAVGDVTFPIAGSERAEPA